MLGCSLVDLLVPVLVLVHQCLCHACWHCAGVCTGIGMFVVVLDSVGAGGWWGCTRIRWHLCWPVH